MAKVAIDARALELISDDEARRVFDKAIGRGDSDDWVVEVGNWLERARLLGFLDRVVKRISSQRDAIGTRESADHVVDQHVLNGIANRAAQLPTRRSVRRLSS